MIDIGIGGVDERLITLGLRGLVGCGRVGGMSGYARELYGAIKVRRREQGLTQTALARRVGCTQSALSMLEQGRADAVNAETLAKLAAELGLALSDFERDCPLPALAPVSAGFCPDPECPSHQPYRVGNRLLLWPRLQASGSHCPYCGELLEHACPTCGQIVRPGACCTACGNPYLSLVQPDNIDAWLAAHPHLHLD